VQERAARCAVGIVFELRDAAGMPILALEIDDAVAIAALGGSALLSEFIRDVSRRCTRSNAEARI
jgi:hypothetical protein